MKRIACLLFSKTYCIRPPSEYMYAHALLPYDTHTLLVYTTVSIALYAYDQLPKLDLCKFGHICATSFSKITMHIIQQHLHCIVAEADFKNHCDSVVIGQLLCEGKNELSWSQVWSEAKLAMQQRQGLASKRYLWVDRHQQNSPLAN